MTICQYGSKLYLSDLEKNPNKLDLSDLVNNDGGLESSLRNYMMQYFWATFDHWLIWRNAWKWAKPDISELWYYL